MEVARGESRTRRAGRFTGLVFPVATCLGWNSISLRADQKGGDWLNRSWNNALRFIRAIWSDARTILIVLGMLVILSALLVVPLPPSVHATMSGPKVGLARFSFSNFDSAATIQPGGGAVNQTTPAGNYDSPGQAANQSTTPKLSLYNLIPIIVQVSSSDVSYTILDKNFNVSIARSNNEINITLGTAFHGGPRVLEINIASDAFGQTPLASLLINLNGSPVPQASSILQIVDSSLNSPFYLLSQTTDGYQLLVHIPHFSTNTVQIVLPPRPNQILMPQIIQYAIPTIVLAAAAVVFCLSVRNRSKKS